MLRGQNPLLQKRNLKNGQNVNINCEISYNENEPHKTQHLKSNISVKKQKKSILLNGVNQKENQKVKKLDNENNTLLTRSVHLYTYGINTQELNAIIRTLRLPIIITKEIQYADAILALENLVKNNRRLKQISYSRKTTIYTIQRHSLLEIVKALQRLDNKYDTFPAIKKQTIRKATRIIDKELLTPLEETRLSIEEIIIPNHKILDLLPRTSSVRKLQRDLVKHYQLNSTNVGNKLNRRVRIYPN